MQTANSHEVAPETIEATWDRVVDRVRQQYLSEKQSFPWIIGFLIVLKSGVKKNCARARIATARPNVAQI